MKLRSPAENYIKYLVCHPDRFDTLTIKERLIDEGLDFISDRYIDGLRAKMKPPHPFRPADRGHAPSFKFIVKERINRIFQPDLPMKMALELLASPRAKEFVETMSLVRVPHSAIASFITKQRGVYCNIPALETYIYYFWNVDLLDSTQMRVLLQMRIETAESNIPEFKDKKKLLTNAYWKDPRKVAADLPYSPTTATLAQMRLGGKPGKTEIALRMIEARDIAWLRAAEAAQQDGPGDSQKFLNYANGGRILEELLQMVVKPEDQLRSQLSSLALRTDTKTVPSIHQLSAGEHTADLTPIKDQSDDPINIEVEHDEPQPDGAGQLDDNG